MLYSMLYSKENRNVHTIQKQNRQADCELGNMKHRWMYMVAVVIAVLFTAVGCTKGPEAAAPEPEGAGSPPSDTAAAAIPPVGHADGSADGFDPAGDNAASSPEETNDGKGKTDISVASKEIEVIDPDGEPDGDGDSEPAQPPATGDGKPRAAPRSYDVLDAFDPARPTLMGLSLGTSVQTAIQRFGQPAETYTLPDEEAETLAFAYPGFTIGVRNGTVLFVEVNGAGVNPGLNGFRLGGTVEEAVQALGQPTLSSEFMLSYTANGAVLKLDVDPETQTVHSIKLFPEE